MSTRVAFMLDGQLSYANKLATEPPANAVARSVERRVNPFSGVQMWWSDREDGHDVYTAQWVDKATWRACQARVKL